MVNLVALILRVIHQLLEFLAEQMHFAEVKRAKVSEEGFIHKIIINAEVEGVLSRLRWRLVADPVEALVYDFHRLVIRSCALAFVTGLDHD